MNIEENPFEDEDIGGHDADQLLGDDGEEIA